MIASFLCTLTLLGELPPLRLELLEGRARCVDGAGVGEWTTPGVRAYEGPGYLECAALSRVDLRWSGVASLSIEGPAAFEWRSARGLNGALCVELLRVGNANFEVRRGPVRIALPEGWVIDVERGAGSLRRLPDGRIEVDYDAGAPLLLAHEDEHGAVRPPWTLLPGGHVRLDARTGAPTAVRRSEGRVLANWERPENEVREARARCAPWTAFAWPWNVEAMEAPPAAEPPSTFAGSANAEHAPIVERGLLDVPQAPVLEFVAPPAAPSIEVPSIATPSIATPSIEVPIEQLELPPPLENPWRLAPWGAPWNNGTR